MKKSLLALAALGMFAGAAQAQSSVTLYGIADAGLIYTSNVGGSHMFSLNSGIASGSRFGLMGSEDLGGGLKAIFRLENGYNINNGGLGQGGRMFGRQAYVGMSGAAWGTLTAGRQYNAMQDYLAPLDIASVNTSIMTHPFDNDNLNNTFRTDNSIKYATPIIAGFQAEAMYSFSNSTSFASNRAYTVGLNYSNGPLKAAAAYAFSQGNGVSGGALQSSTSGGSVYGSNALGSAVRINQWGAGATYAFGPATIGLLYTGSLFNTGWGAGVATPFGTTGTAVTGQLRFQNIEGSFRYMLTPALQLAVGETYTRATLSGVGGGNYWQTNLGTDYNLSKRTDLYTTVAYQKTSSGLPAAVAAAGSESEAAFASGSNQVVVSIGMRHKF